MKILLPTESFIFVASILTLWRNKTRYSAMNILSWQALDVSKCRVKHVLPNASGKNFDAERKNQTKYNENRVSVLNFENVQQFHTSSMGRGAFHGTRCFVVKEIFRSDVYCTWFPPCRWQGYSPHGLCKSALRAGESRQVLPPSPRFRTCLLLVIFSDISVYPSHR